MVDQEAAHAGELVLLSGHHLDGELRAGRARIALEHLGPAQSLDVAATRATMGAQADARAFLVMRPYLSRAVLVPVTDPADPTPYWLVGSRHPDALAAAINARPATPLSG